MPLLYIAGLARAANAPVKVLVDGYAYGSISMTCYGLDAECPKNENTRPAASLPNPEVVPPENTNL
jgi:4,5-DOPA dioxygenase extradiol